MKHSTKRKIVEETLKLEKGNLNPDQMMELVTCLMWDLFKADKKVKRLKFWNSVLAFLVILDVVVFWATKLIK